MPNDPLALWSVPLRAPVRYRVTVLDRLGQNESRSGQTSSGRRSIFTQALSVLGATPAGWSRQKSSCDWPLECQAETTCILSFNESSPMPGRLLAGRQQGGADDAQVLAPGPARAQVSVEEAS